MCLNYPQLIFDICVYSGLFTTSFPNNQLFSNKHVYVYNLCVPSDKDCPGLFSTIFMLLFLIHEYPVSDPGATMESEIWWQSQYITNL